MGGSDESESESESETGYESGETGEPVPLEPDECQHNTDESVVGVLYQCEGELTASIDFELLGDDCEDHIGSSWCTQNRLFGSQDGYPSKVSACCGEFDIQYKSVYQQYCIYDVYQQLCITLAERFEDAILDGRFGIYDNQAADIQVWIAENYDDCFGDLLANDTGTFPEVVSYWELGDFGLLHDVVLNIQTPTGVDGVNLPVDEQEWIACNGASHNDDQVFEDAHSPNGGIIASVDLAADLDGEVVGPSIFGGPVTASATFPDGCVPRGCAAAEFSYDATIDPLFTMEELDLFADAVVFTNGISILSADRAQVSLWTQAEGYKVLDPLTGLVLGYEIPAGAAHFLVSFMADTTANRFMAQNSTNIWITRPFTGTWVIDSFDLEYVDGLSNTWTLTLDNSSWD